MFQIYHGNLTSIKYKLKELASKYNISKIKFSKSIMSERLYGLFYEPTLYYFLYDKSLFADKETIEGFIQFAESTDSILVCILEEQLDKKTVQYKKLKQYITEINNTEHKKTDEKTEILKDLSYTYNIENNRFISVLFALQYSKYSKPAGFVLSLILTGRLNNIDIAKKLFITLCTMRKG